jgi:hypothetical protein
MAAFALGCGIVLGGAAGARMVHPFLAPTRPVAARALIVEGWLPDYALGAALAEFQGGNYELFFTTGGPLERGSFLSEYRTYAGVAAATLQRLGMDTNALIVIDAPPRHRNRTFASAVALREHCEAHGIRLDAVNLVSLGAHARRSRLCFARALGPASVRVGVIAVEDADYDPQRWWRFSEGVKTVGGETLAFLYAWFRVDYGN